MNTVAPINATPPEGTPPAPPASRTPYWLSGLLILLIIAFFGYIIWGQWEAEQLRRAELAAKIQAQSDLNKKLADEAELLREALKKDPCAALDFLKAQGSQAIPSGKSGEPLMIPSKEENKTTEPQKSPTDAAKEPTKEPEKEQGTIADRLEKSTVLIISIPADPKNASMGSGFFIAPGIILTNRHVVGDPKAKIFVANKAINGVLPGKIVAFSNKQRYDFAVIALETAPNVPDLAFNTNIKRTDRISTWGFPGMVTESDPKFLKMMQGDDSSVPEVVYTEGAVSTILEETPPLIVHTATVSQGNSGGPLINANGEVVGINTYIKVDNASYRQSNLSIGSKDIIKFLNASGVPYTLGAEKVTPAKGKGK